jgi:hypothetical protein
VPRGPPGLDDVDEDDDVVELLVADDDVVCVALCKLVVAAAFEESSAKLLHAAVLTSNPVDSSAVPSTRRVRPMTPHPFESSPPSAADRRVCGRSTLRRRPETVS